MKLLFNKSSNGNAELKSLLGYLDADFKFSNLKIDIEHATLDLIKLIGQTTYDKIVTFYEGTPTQAESDLIQNTQLPIAVFAELSFASNNDLNNSNNGRVVEIGENQRQPWEWQIERSESNSRRRGYKALDILIDTLDNYGLTEWDDSDEYKASKQYFIYTTYQMQMIFQINNSRQLYLRLLQFMNDPEEDDILPIIGATRYAALKVNILDDTLQSADKQLLKLIQRPVAFKALENAFKVLPIEMFPNGIIEYREKGRMTPQAKSEVLLYFKDKAKQHLVKLQEHISTLDLVSAVQDPEENIGGDKFVNL